VLLPIGSRLQIRHSVGAIQLIWPISSGANALQFSNTPTITGSWTTSTNTPVVVGDQFMLTEPLSAQARFYRLQIGQ
jgi:hypothetical protein